MHSDRLDPCFQSTAIIIPGRDDKDDADCAVPAPGPVPDDLTVPIDYLAKDFSSFCQALSDFSAARYPHWIERSEADVGVMLMEALSALADELSYLQDRVAAEATIDTATQALSLLRHARLVDYEPAPPLAATTLLQLDVGATPPTGLVRCQAAGEQGETVDFTADAESHAFIGAGQPGLKQQWNRYADEAGTQLQLVPYRWDVSERCLRQGATSMWLRGHQDFYPGQMPNQLANFGDGTVPFEVAARSHTLGEVEPEIGVRNGFFASSAFGSLFVAHISENGAAEFAFFQAQPQSRPNRTERPPRGGSNPAHIHAKFARQASRPTTLYKTDGKAGHTSQCESRAARKTQR